MSVQINVYLCPPTTCSLGQYKSILDSSDLAGPLSARAAEIPEIQAHLCEDLSGELQPLTPSLALGAFPALLASSAVNQHENK